MKVVNWCELNKLNYSLIGDNELLLEVDKKTFIVIQPKDNILFDKEFNIIIDINESGLIQKYNIENYLFEFGGNWYHSPIDKETIELKPFKYIGQAVLDDKFEFPYLGIHGKYDLCNGSRDYSDWIKKANFLGINTLGICETNTLAGTLPFQLACEKYGIKHIIGEEVFVRYSNLNEEFFIKIYVQNQIGWRNLLLINSEINVHNHEENYIEFKKLLELSEGLICVISTLNPLVIEKLKKSFELVYFQIDPVEYLSDEKDKEHLLNLKNYLDNFIDILQPVIICDSYYLDKEDSEIRHILNKVGKSRFYNQSHDQYFKSTDDIFIQLIPLFKESDERLESIIDQSLLNLKNIENLCDFNIETGVFHLPQYEMTDSEKESFDTNEDLFWELIQRGFNDKIAGQVIDEDIYWDRIEKEARVIQKGGFIDYFLILWDIVNWCHTQDILVGVGRGSAAGSLIAYLFGLVSLDPIKYNLLFERFLNESRLKSSPPDIDLDFEGNRRGDIKEYIESKYGVDYVTSIGTYSTLKMKAAIKDLGRIENIPPQTLNYFTSMIEAESSFTELFIKAASTPRLKQFIQGNVELINQIPKCFEQPKSRSIHAAGVVIVPKADSEGNERNVFSWVPVRREGELLVTEWEGYFIDQAGFLKADILGIRQLEKFKNILNLIKENTGEEVKLKDIPLDNEDVYELFRQGFTEDVFQFGATGLKGYCQVLKPDNIEDLIATVALYRPGPMEIGAHTKYAKIKNGESYPDYLPGTREITEATYSNIVYQEQVMAICSSVGGFSLSESDDVRRAMGKKNLAEMEKYQAKFIDNAITNGYNRVSATQLWNNLESFASYAFNRSHAASYAFTGYYCQWFKVMFPIEFWISALKYSKDDELPSRINEIHKTSKIKLLPPDINHSHSEFIGNREKKTIYWSLSSVKFISEKASQAIITERESGLFTSVEDFRERVDKRVVNKRVVLNLILCGAFDQLYNIPVDQPEKRFPLIRDFYISNNDEVPGEYNPETIWKSYFFTFKQKELCGLGYIDYGRVFKTTNITHQFLSEDDIFLDHARGRDKCIGGVIHDIIERDSRKGIFAQITLDCNNQIVTCIMWAEIWPDYKEKILSSKGKILFISGEVKHDSYRQCNVLQTNKATKIVIV